MRQTNVNGNVKNVRLRWPNASVYEPESFFINEHTMNHSGLLLGFRRVPHPVFRRDEPIEYRKSFLHVKRERQRMTILDKHICRDELVKKHIWFVFIFYSFFVETAQQMLSSVIHNLIGAALLARSAFFASWRLRASTTPTLPLRAKRWLRTNLASIWNKTINTARD